MLTNMFPSTNHPVYGIFVKRQIDSIRKLGHEVTTLFVNGRASTFSYVAGIRQLRTACKVFRPDLIHAHYGLTGFLACFQKFCPLIISLCGSDVLGSRLENGELTFKSRLIRRLTRAACQRSHHLIVKSRIMGEELEKRGIVDFHIIPNGVDLNVFFPEDPLEAREKLGLEPHKKLILFPYPRKGEINALTW